MREEYILTEYIQVKSISDNQTHFLPKELANEWLKTFGLKDLNEDFKPSFTPKIKEILAKQGVNEVHLKLGSLIKLELRDRTNFIHFIKPTLENANILLKQNDGALIFVKDFGVKKFFASVARDKQGEWIVTSNAPKSLNNVKNKLNDGGKILFSDLPEFPIIARPDLTTKALNGEANHAKIIPNNIQTSQTKPKTRRKR